MSPAEEGARWLSGPARPDRRSVVRRAVGSQLAAYGASIAPARLDGRFLIVCTPRSGSELLVNLLDQLPQVDCVGEVLDHEVRWPARFLEGRARVAAAAGARVWGCKVLAQHLLWHESRYGASEALLRRLVDEGWLLVHLRRADLLASALSALHAEQTGRFHLRDGPDLGFEPVDADPATILAWVHSFDEYQRWLDEAVAPLPRVVVSYEDDLTDAVGQQAAVDRVAAALGTPAAPVAAGLRPSAPVDPMARVADPTGVRELFRLTRFAHLVGERPLG